MYLGDAVPGEKKGGKTKKRIFPDPVEEARGQAYHPSKADPRLPGRQQGAQ